MKRDLDQMPNCLCFNLRKVTRVITQFYTTAMPGEELLPTQTPILMALSQHPNATMADLCSWLAMDRTTLVRALRPLERAGLVLSSGEGRGRPSTLVLTPLGRRTLNDFIPRWQTVQRKAIATLGAERWTQILDDLDRVTATFHS